MEILAAKDLSFTYPKSPRKALDSVSFSVDEGDFVCLCGTTGSGKSTLLRLFKPELYQNADISGDIYFCGRRLSECSPDERMSIGYVMQCPDEQIVCDKVIHELCFGMENLAYPQSKMELRLAEISAFFGLGDILDKNVADLSGGQKQLLNIASVMTLNPSVLILDEPCAQLDPVSASAFLGMTAKLNRELGTTVIIAEHRLDGVIPLANRLIALDSGKVAADDITEEAVRRISAHPALAESMSAPVKLYYSLGAGGKCPLTVKDGERYLKSRFKNTVRSVDSSVTSGAEEKKEKAVEFRNAFFRYERHGANILNDLSLSVGKGEFFCILGENGCGKSTVLSACAGINRIQSGKIRIFGKDIYKYSGNGLYENCVTFIPQDVKTVFLKNTVAAELDGCEKTLRSFPFDFSYLNDEHPYDLSGGEAQLLALAKALSREPRILLLDEPTKGLDTHFAVSVGNILKELTSQGLTVIAVTHDMNFAAHFADRCAMIFGGKICACGTPRVFFSQNSFYTTPYSRMSRGFFDNAVTLEDVRTLCELNGMREEVFCEQK